MNANSNKSVDYRIPTISKWHDPRAVVDGERGIIIATAKISASPEQIYNSFTTKEVELWRGIKLIIVNKTLINKE